MPQASPRLVSPHYPSSSSVARARSARWPPLEGVTPPTMTRLVAAMAADGLVDRLPDPTDRRVVKVQASATGRSLLLAGRDRRVATLAAMLKPLTPKERRRLNAGGGHHRTDARAA